MRIVTMAFIAARGNPCGMTPGITVLKVDMERFALVSKLTIAVDLSSEDMYDDTEFMPDFALAESLLSKLDLLTGSRWVRSDCHWAAEILPAG